MRLKLVVLLIFLPLVGVTLRAQFTDSTTGLLQMPSGTMQPNGTFMITNNYLNRHTLSPVGWGYDTFAYGFSLTFWKRLEVGYICTIFNGKLKANPSEFQKILVNQDRHFMGRFMILQEGEFGWSWLPSLVVGVSDPTTASLDKGYLDPSAVHGSSNGYFNRMYAVVAKHFDSAWGELAIHAGYQRNFRDDYSLKGPCVGLEWKPVWLNDLWLMDNLDLIAEYDARTVNVGAIISLWDNRFEAMLELQNLRWLSFGLRYKLRLR